MRVHDYAGSFSITIMHMHGLRDLAGKGDTPSRVAQAEKLVRLVGTLHKPGERLVVCGDFNVLPASFTLQSLREIGLMDLVTTLGHDDTRTSYYKKEGRFADYMLVNGEVIVQAFDVVREPEVSDHRALFLDLG